MQNKNKSDEESTQNVQIQLDEKNLLVNNKSNERKGFSQHKNLALIMSCMKADDYCFTMTDYLKKMFHFSQIDYYLAFTQILYCFKPKEM